MKRFRSHNRAPCGAVATTVATARATSVAMAVAMLCVVFFSGCLFDAREADPPGSAGAPSVILDAPQKVFVAMEASFQKDNDVDYERALSDGFLFSPLLDDSLDQALPPSIYKDWTKDVELDVLRLLQSESNLTVIFETTALINENTFVRFDVFYVLGVISSGTPPDTTVYSGTSQIDVRNEGGNWRMTYWKDISAELGFRTWGYLRGITRDRLNP